MPYPSKRYDENTEAGMVDCVNLWYMDRNYPLYRSLKNIFACIYALVSHAVEDGRIEFNVIWYVLVDSSGTTYIFEEEIGGMYPLEEGDDPEDMMRRTGVKRDNILVVTMPELDSLTPPPGWDMYDRESGSWLDYLEALYSVIERGNRMLEELDSLEKGQGNSNKPGPGDHLA